MTKIKSRPLTVPNVAKCFEDLVTSKSENTQRAYRYDVAQFQRFTRDETPADALYSLLLRDRVGAREWVQTYQKKITRSHAQATVQRRIAALQSFVSSARKLGMIDWDLEVDRPTAMTAETKKATARRKMAGPKPEQLLVVRQLLKAENTNASKRDLAIIALLVNPMLRRAELARLNVGDFDFDDPAEPKVTVIGKGRDEPETLELDPAVVRDVQAWLAVRGGRGSDPAFVQVKQNTVLPKYRLGAEAIYHMTLRRGIQAKLKKPLRPHGLRHTGITVVANHVAKHGLPVTEGMAVSRHKDAKTFWNYVDDKGSKKRSILRALAAKTS